MKTFSPEFESDLRDIGSARAANVTHHMQYWVIDAADEPLEVTRLTGRAAPVRNDGTRSRLKTTTRLQSGLFPAL